MGFNKKLDLKIIITYPEILEKAILNHNEFRGTDFKVIETIIDEVPFCRIVASNYTDKDLFGLGYKLGILEQKYNQKKDRT